MLTLNSATSAPVNLFTMSIGKSTWSYSNPLIFQILSDILPVIADCKLNTTAAATIEFYFLFMKETLPVTGTLTLETNFTSKR